ncbi:MAG: hypothetical protein ABT20_13520 [Rubrivivax sp. SCN 70-15]|nr:MAG: hypothetical protein ABT20_13520 [Rubrivivax sp. SCN 70-15]
MTNTGFYQFDVGRQFFKIGGYSLVGFLTYRIFFEQCTLPAHPLAGQRNLSFELFELGLERLVVDLGQQSALGHIGSLLEMNPRYFARSFERQIHLFVGNKLTLGTKHILHRLVFQD